MIVIVTVSKNPNRTSVAIQAFCQEDLFVVGVAIYTPVGSEATLGELLPPGFKMIAQREGDFGTRLLGAAEDLFSVGFSAVCLIDADSPTLPFIACAICQLFSEPV